MSRDFDIFCSYARGDNDDGWVDKFVTAVTAAYRKLTGQAPHLFMDRESLMTADIWDKKIRSALEASQVLIAVISPSYVRSAWCEREWKTFSQCETALREQQLIADEQGLIFPVLLFPLDRGRFNEQQHAFCATIRKRQWLDVSSQLLGTPIRPEQVRKLVEQLIDSEAALEQRRRRALSAPMVAIPATTIRDPATGLEWSASLSPREMSPDEAIEYVKELGVHGATGWRLPTKDELESIIDHTALVDDSEASPYPLREPFNAQRFGYLLSGTLIKNRPGEYYIMNVRNGHIFNGKGYRCYVRAVRTLSNPSMQPTA